MKVLATGGAGYIGGRPIPELLAQRVGLPCLLSDTITREVDVTGTCKFLSIRDPRVWADALMSLPGRAEGVRAMKGHRDCFDRYDIEKAALKLTSYYRQLSEKA